ncbi:MAG: ATP-binding cassette domain-containing protein [Dongiaceae bacterium]
MEIDALCVTAAGGATLVDRLSLALEAGRPLGLVGPSGCGKTMTVAAILGLPPPGVRVTGGSIRLAGRPRPRLGRDIFAIPQDAGGALDPTMICLDQVAEIYRVHEKLGRDAARVAARDVLAQVGLDAGSARRYPAELSGGMRQRVTIAMALALRPLVLVADEPTTGLDTLVQRSILDLMERHAGALGQGLLLISHDLRVVTRLCPEVAVMAQGRIVDCLPASRLAAEATSVHTRALLAAHHRLSGAARARGA